MYIPFLHINCNQFLCEVLVHIYKVWLICQTWFIFCQMWSICHRHYVYVEFNRSHTTSGVCIFKQARVMPPAPVPRCQPKPQGIGGFACDLFIGRCIYSWPYFKQFASLIYRFRKIKLKTELVVTTGACTCISITMYLYQV